MYEAYWMSRSPRLGPCVLLMNNSTYVPAEFKLTVVVSSTFY